MVLRILTQQVIQLRGRLTPVSGLLIAAGIAGFDNDDTDDSDATLRAKYVTQVGAYDMNFEGGVVFADDEIFTLGTDLYLDKTFSIGLGYTDDGEDDTFQIRAQKILQSTSQPRRLY